MYSVDVLFAWFSKNIRNHILLNIYKYFYYYQRRKQHETIIGKINYIFLQNFYKIIFIPFHTLLHLQKKKNNLLLLLLVINFIQCYIKNGIKFNVQFKLNPKFLHFRINLWGRGGEREGEFVHVLSWKNFRRNGIVKKF